MAHGPDIGPRAARFEVFAQFVRVIRAISQQDIARLNRRQHIVRTAPIMSLAFRDLQRDRQAIGIDQRVDLRRQAAARATHATGSDVFFLPLAAC